MFLTVETGRASLYNGINRSMDSLDMFSSKSLYLRASIILFLYQAFVYMKYTFF